jgi:putative tricarboxylic transport membrane protein
MGLALRRLDFPIAPVIIGMILGPMAEIQFRRGIQISQGDVMAFIERPISLALLLTALLLLIGPTLLRTWRRGTSEAATG